MHKLVLERIIGPPGSIGPQPRQLLSPPRTTSHKNTMLSVDKWLSHGWWITVDTNFPTWQYVEAQLWITSDPINNVTLFSGLASSYGAVKSIASPRLDGDDNFYITA